MTIRYIVQELMFLVCLILQIVILIRMYRERLYVPARWFFVYVAFQIVANPVEYLAYHTSAWAKFYVVWGANVITVSLGFAIIGELFSRAFTPYEAIRRTARNLFLSALIVLIAVAVLSAVYQKSGTGHALFDLVLKVERVVRIVQLGLIITLFLLTSSLGLRWRSCLFGIALGFGFYALVDLTTLALWMRIGAGAGPLYGIGIGLAYTLSVVIWTGYILQPEVAKIPVADWPSGELARWDKALSQLLR